MKVLIVDDDPGMRLVVRQYVSHHFRDGAEIFEAENGYQGLVSYETSKPDLLITDLQMPEMNGDQLAFIIREKDKKIPIVLHTSTLLPDDHFKLYTKVIGKHEIDGIARFLTEYYGEFLEEEEI